MKKLSPRMQQRSEWDGLKDVRAAIKGWSFTSKNKLPSYIQAGEVALRKAPVEHWDAGQALIEPLREALRRK